ncbi:hypothetical protein M011DRAFT_466384 [Sporormia fimetaria CBS 119925]|uniref:SGF29 C-terminal domain-containing protein n=1 Tax=Sporormia fimetaria CBS 119925 TaxID=1340428 RepID=A0A6A6VFU0_9PLEO|nr:hypothetical protein M011DRAFT_466384 [Sporormia fimetaria CBS 119925]
MAARSRPRASQLKDQLDEEHSLWAQILEDTKALSALEKQQDAVSKKIVELNIQKPSPPETRDDDLEKKLRENIRLSEKITEDGAALCSKLEILAALRDSHEAEPTASRSASVGKSQRDRQMKRKLTENLDDRDSIASDTPAGHPSPKVLVSNKDRLKAMSASSRAGSMPATRETSVKVEDSADSLDVKGALPTKPPLTLHTEVLYRNHSKSRPSTEGEGILCRVTAVIGEGKQRRYEIIDADPEPDGGPAQPYRASVNHLVAIPPPAANATLPDLKVGKNVLALYPGTTTFYRAEVVGSWKSGRDGGNGEKGKEVEFVRLRFDGEEEAEKEQSVERRYVLPER